MSLIGTTTETTVGDGRLPADELDSFESFVAEVADRLERSADGLERVTPLDEVSDFPLGLGNALLLGHLGELVGREVPLDLFESIDTLGELYEWARALQ